MNSTTFLVRVNDMVQKLDAGKREEAAEWYFQEIEPYKVIGQQRNLKARVAQAFRLGGNSRELATRIGRIIDGPLRLHRQTAPAITASQTEPPKPAQKPAVPPRKETTLIVRQGGSVEMRAIPVAEMTGKVWTVDLTNKNPSIRVIDNHFALSNAHQKSVNKFIEGKEQERKGAISAPTSAEDEQAQIAAAIALSKELAG